MEVPGGKRTLLCHIFQFRYCMQCFSGLSLRAGLIQASGFYAACMSPTHNESLEIQSFEHCDEIEICGGIIFIFYVGLPTYITPSLINELVSA